MNTLFLDESAREVHKALIKPIHELLNILKQKLDGSFKTAKVIGWFEIEDLYRVFPIQQFPGECFIESNDGQRTLRMVLKFDWLKFAKNPPEKPKPDSIALIMAEKGSEDPNQFWHISIEVLDDESFIMSLKNWLNDGSEMPWKRWA